LFIFKLREQVHSSFPAIIQPQKWFGWLFRLNSNGGFIESEFVYCHALTGCCGNWNTKCKV